MKLLVWLLVLLNLGLLAYFNLDLVMPRAVVVDRSLKPEKMKLLSENDLAAMPKKVATKPTTAAAEMPAQAQISCYKWGNFTKTNLPSAQVVLVRLGLQSAVSEEAMAKEDKRFWVYYPPLKTAALAQQKATELKALGVTEFFIVQDSQWRNAISFGLFQDEHLATNLLDELQTKGVKGATKALHNLGKSLSSLLIKSVSADAALELHKIKPEFIGTELAPVACP